MDSFDFDAYNADNFNNTEPFYENNDYHMADDINDFGPLEFIELPQLSDEQNTIINAVEQNNNVIVDAVPGSGKSTLVFGLAKKLYNKHILQITYNKSLRDEVYEKCRNYGINNLEIRTYHGLAHNYYDRKIWNDLTLKEYCIDCNAKIPACKVPKFDIIVIDEAQDMKGLYFQLMKKFIKDTKQPILLIMGDHNQAINAYNGADYRFLTLADMLWELPFLKLTLNQSFRLTDQIANFVNQLSHREIKVNKLSPERVKYIHGWLLAKNRNLTYQEEEQIIMNYQNPKSDHIISIIICQIIKLLTIDGYKQSDIFILTNSFGKDEHFTKTISNYLSKLTTLRDKNGENIRILTYAPKSESDEHIKDVNLTKDKLVFGTFASCKGLERKVVFVCHFDMTHFINYAQNVNESEYSTLQNIHYVAMTRASEILYLVHIEKYINGNNNNDRIIQKLPCLTDDIMINSNLEFLNKIPKLDSDKSISKKKIGDFTPAVTEFIKFLKDDMTEEIAGNDGILKTIDLQLHDKIYSLCIDPIKKFDNDNMEIVSTLFGTALPMAWEYKLSGFKHCTILTTLNDNFTVIKESNPELVSKVCNRKNIIIRENKDFAIIANLYETYINKWEYTLSQITDYQWFTDDILNKSLNAFDKYISNISIFEKNILAVIKYNTGTETVEIKEIKNINIKSIQQPRYARLTISGCVDGICVHTNTLWEFKCVSEITLIHMIQLALYAFMWENLHELDSNNQIQTCYINWKGVGSSKDMVVSGITKKEKIINIQSSKKITNYRYKIFNVNTGEIRELIYDNEKINRIVELLCKNKYYVDEEKNDELFIEKSLQSIQLYDKFNNKTIEELKELCAKLNVNLPIIGQTKDVLIKMVKNPFAYYEPNNNYLCMNKTDLVELCRNRKIKNFSGKSKEILTAMLKEYDDNSPVEDITDNNEEIAVKINISDEFIFDDETKKTGKCKVCDKNMEYKSFKKHQVSDSHYKKSNK